MMFEIVRTLFDHWTYRYNDAEISMALQHILDNYSNRGLKDAADSINYNDPALRCAYIYLYSTSHAQMVVDTLSNLSDSNFKEFKNWTNKLHTVSHLNVCSIGGGPGNDLLGILQFCFDHDARFSNPIGVNLTLVDAYYGWEGTFRACLEQLVYWKRHSPFYVGSVSVLIEDLLKSFSPLLEWHVQRADILSMVKFVSAVSADAEGCVFLLKHILKLMKLGSWILYIDNAGGASFKLFNSVVVSQGFEPVYGPIYPYRFHVNRLKEPMFDVRCYVNRFGIHPQTSSTLAVGVWKKPAAARLRGLKRTISADVDFREMTTYTPKRIAHDTFSKDRFDGCLLPLQNNKLASEVPQESPGKCRVNDGIRPKSRLFTDETGNLEKLDLSTEKLVVNPDEQPSLGSTALSTPQNNAEMTRRRPSLLGNSPFHIPDKAEKTIEQFSEKLNTFHDTEHSNMKSSLMSTPVLPELPRKRPSLLGNSPFHVPSDHQCQTSNVIDTCSNENSYHVATLNTTCTPQQMSLPRSRPSLLGNSPFHIPGNIRRNTDQILQLHPTSNEEALAIPSSSSASLTPHQNLGVPGRPSLLGNSPHRIPDNFQGYLTNSPSFLTDRTRPPRNEPKIPKSPGKRSAKTRPDSVRKSKSPKAKPKRRKLLRKCKNRTKHFVNAIRDFMNLGKSSPSGRKPKRPIRRNKSSKK